MARNGQISRNQERAISTLLITPCVPRAAKQVGIGERTLWRWLKNETFQENYRQARKTIVKQTVTQIQAGMALAVETLREIMSDEKAPSSAKVSAARTMLDMGLKATEIEDLESRIEKLEKELMVINKR